jgi:cytochrome P450
MRAPLYSSEAAELFSPSAIEDPYPLYARLRKDRPLSRVAETGVHLVASWDLIEEALGRDADFSAHLTGVLMRDEHGEPSVFDLRQGAPSQVIATADEPRHAVHRAIAQPRLAASQAAKLEAPIRSWARSSVREWLAGGAGDFVPLAELIPARVVAEVLGLPSGDVTRFRTWAMMGGDILAGDVDQARLIRLSVETEKMLQYLGEHLDEARRKPRPEVDAPLFHALARGVEAGDLDRDEAIGIASVMFGAGGESTAALIGSVARWLAENPDLASQLRQNPALVSLFVEEVLRLQPPFNFHYRVVLRECELGGFTLRQGDRLMLLWASANRDAARLAEPDALRLDRRHPKNHLGFGRGSHFCIGAPIARLEARVVCEELLAATDSISLSETSPHVYANSIFTHRLERLPLVARTA